MSRRHRKRRHQSEPNHEAWAIPYADLLTLLLAFFVVMYAISSVNEGKYRILSDSLVAAFRGAPRSLQPIQVGEKQVGSGADIQMSIVTDATLEGQPRQLLEAVPLENDEPRRNGVRTISRAGIPLPEFGAPDDARHLLKRVADEVEIAMADLVRDKEVVIRRFRDRVEVEIRTDILFEVGSASLASSAVRVIERLGETLAPFPNVIRVEGHTDNLPIKTVAYRSNWELSAARAATVVRLMSEQGVQPQRLAVLGFGEYQPAATNATPDGRNINRRVLLIVTGVDGTVPYTVETDGPTRTAEVEAEAGAEVAPDATAAILPQPEAVAQSESGAAAGTDAVPPVAAASAIGAEVVVR